MSFRTDLAELINRHSLENGSDTPDFILANYLCNMLNVFDQVVEDRDRWHGFKKQSIYGVSAAPVPVPSAYVAEPVYPDTPEEEIPF